MSEALRHGCERGRKNKPLTPTHLMRILTGIEGYDIACERYKMLTGDAPPITKKTISLVVEKEATG